MIYIGQHHSDKFSEDYVGSGIIIQNILRKLKSEAIPKENRFKVVMIDSADSKEELNEKEKYYIEKFNSRNPEVGYNMRAGGDCGPGGPMFKGHHHSEQTRKNMSLNRSGENNANYGNHWNQTDVAKKRISEATSGDKNPMYGIHRYGESSPFFGKQHSEESKQLNRQKHLGKKAYNNGKINKMFDPNGDIPDGFVLGFLKK